MHSNLDPTIGGFWFKGIHSSTYGVRQTPTEQVLIPQKRRRILTIPGRSVGVVEEDGGYEPRTESVLCTYVHDPTLGYTLQRQVRRIGGWLSGVGELTFDREPEMHYKAFLSSPPPSYKALEHASFQLEFEFVTPFAYENAEALVFQNVLSGNKHILQTDGTLQTPVRIIIKNTGTKTINQIQLVRRYLTEEQGV